LISGLQIYRDTAISIGLPRASKEAARTKLMLIGETPTPALPPKSAEEAFGHIAAAEIGSTVAPSHKRLLIAVLGFAILVMAVALLWRFANRPETPNFQLTQLNRGAIESTVSATGACNAVVTVQVGSQVSGNIKALYADFNTRVKAGQLVALIDPEIFQAKVMQAEAAWRHSQAALEAGRADARKAEANLFSAIAAEANQAAAITKAKVAVSEAYAKLVRRQKMFADRLISKEDLDTAQATHDQAVAEVQAAEAQRDAAQHNIQSAEASLQAANKQVAMFQEEVDLSQAALNQMRIDLAHTRIKAPVEGTVVARRVDVGQTVAASFQAPTIFEIAQDLTKMQVDTNVAESDVGRLKVEQEASFTVDAYPGILFKGRVAQIRKAPINVQNVITYDAVIEVANPELKLFPGMTANVTILTQRRENVLKIPNAALRFRPPESLIQGSRSINRPRGGSWGAVYIPEPSSKARSVPVKLGITDGNFTEMEEGDLQDGQQVIVAVYKPVATPVPVAPSIPRRF
jgi:HlyD family secretion protein